MQSLNPSQLSMSSEELQKVSKVQLEITPNAHALHINFARQIADEISFNNRAGKPTRLILPVGPVLQYPLLVQICNQEQISWRSVTTFNMDEYCDWQGRAIPVDHPLSFEGFMRRVLFEQLDDNLRIPEDQVHFPNPLRLDDISKAIAAVGGVDTCYGGIGYHGHVAFNEPEISRWCRPSIDEFRNAKTRVVQLAPDSIVMNSIRNTGGDSTHFPPLGVTLGMSDILAARRIRMYCPGGAWQRHAVRIACLGEEDVDYPVTLLQNHSDYVLYTDMETAAPIIPNLGL